MNDEDLVSLAQQGDQRALEELLERHRGMVKGIAARFDVSAEEREDLLQEGMIGLWKAVQAFQRARGARFVALARVCARRQMISALWKIRISFEIPAEIPAQKEKGPSPWGLKQAVFSIMTPLERQVFEGYLEGKSYAAIAAELKLTPKKVDNVLQKAKKNAKRKLGVEEVKRKARPSGRLSTVGPA